MKRSGSAPIVVLLGVALLFELPELLSPSLVNAAMQMLIAALFATAFNLLCGQAGMLSFGHAAYFGIGAFGTAHAMAALGGAGLLPTPLLPLAGAAVGLLTGLVAGWFATKRSGVYFSMITLALAELLHGLGSQLKNLFGGEGGVSVMRQAGFGIGFDKSTHLYYLVLVWVLLSIALMYLYTLTPAGRLSFGLRENAMRLKFLGYDVHRQRVLAFAASAMFSGIAGSLQVINNESASSVLFELRLSAEVVLNAFIGGVAVFLGPALGAAVMTFFGYALSDLTRSWLLYQGILFVMVMMVFPSGLAGLLQAVSALRCHGSRGLALFALAISAAALLSAATVFSIELVQRIASQDYQSLRVAGAPWPAVALFGRSWWPESLWTWCVPALLAAAGLQLVQLARGRWRRLDEASLERTASATSIAASARPP